MVVAIKESEKKETKLKNGIIVPEDIKLSPQDIEALNELAETQSPKEIEELLVAERSRQQKQEQENLERMFRGYPTLNKSSSASCVEYSKSKMYSTQKGFSYYQERKVKRGSKIKRAKQVIRNPLHLPGWWRDILKKKKDYGIPEHGDKERVISKAKKFFKWEKGEWTLGVWWARVPIEALWEFALAATDKYACDRNPVYFAKCLATAAELFPRYPDPRVWHEVSQRLGPYFKLSRERLLMLLEAITKALKQVLRGGELLNNLIKKFLPVPKRADIEMFKPGWDTS